MWQQSLADHPDKQFSSYILQGLAHGFHIGVDRSIALRPSRGNMPSVREQPQLVQAHIQAEFEARCLLGPLPPHLACLVQTNPTGLIPKPHQPGKFKLIVDLSSPAGASVNDAISISACYLQYASVLDAARLIQQLGPGTQLAKLDLQIVYRIVPVHADDHHLLGICWDQHVPFHTPGIQLWQKTLFRILLSS